MKNKLMTTESFLRLKTNLYFVAVPKRTPIISCLQVLQPLYVKLLCKFCYLFLQLNMFSQDQQHIFLVHSRLLLMTISLG